MAPPPPPSAAAVEAVTSTVSCTDCSLHARSPRPVPPTTLLTAPRSDLMILVEPCNREAVEAGHPLGRPSDLRRYWLNVALLQAQLVVTPGTPPDQLDQFPIVPTVACRLREMDDARAAQVACSANVHRALAAVKPKVVLAVGAEQLRWFRDAGAPYPHGLPMFVPSLSQIDRERPTVAMSISRPDLVALRYGAGRESLPWESEVIAPLAEAIRRAAAPRSDDTWPDACFWCARDAVWFDNHGIGCCIGHSRNLDSRLSPQDLKDWLSGKRARDDRPEGLP